MGKVDDVPVNMHDKFPQSWPTDSEMVLQIQFIGRLSNSSFATETGTNSVNCAETPEILQRRTWMVVDAPVVCDNRCRRWSRQFSLSGGASVAVLSTCCRHLDVAQGPRAMLGSTVDTCSAVAGWLLEEFQDFLREGVDSGPEVDSRPALLRLRSATSPRKSGYFSTALYLPVIFGSRIFCAS